MNNRGILLLDYFELIISIIGSIIFLVVAIVIREQQSILFILASLYLIYNIYCKISELKLFNRKNRIIKYYGKKVNI